MTATSSKNLNLENCYKKIDYLNLAHIKKFERVFKNHSIFNTIFIILIASQVLFLGLFFTALVQNSIIVASTVAAIFLTLFSYFALRFYFKSQRTEKLSEICESYFQACKKFLNYQEGVTDYHVLFANIAHRFVRDIEKREFVFSDKSKFLNKIFPFMEKLNYLRHCRDWLKIKELLSNYAIEEHLKRIKHDPMNLEAHASLANAYVLLSNLYKMHLNEHHEQADLLSEHEELKVQSKFEKAAKCAIEEFEILSEYAPNEPWVHFQLACNYHNLQMLDEEIKQYEILLSLNRNDKDTLLKLGTLYFKQGYNAKGLQIYNEMKKVSPRQAENLIKFYGSKECV